MDDVHDLRDTIVPKSDQLNADDLLAGPITARVMSVRRGDRDQPIAIGIDGGRQPFKPCKSMRRVLIAGWGNDGREWVGRSMMLFCDPDVVFAGVKVGGIRISHLSHIDADLELRLTVTRGKRAPYLVKRLAAAEPDPDRAYLRAHPDPEQVAAARRELFGEKTPLTREDIARLANTLRQQQPISSPDAEPPPDDNGGDDDPITGDWGGTSQEGR